MNAHFTRLQNLTGDPLTLPDFSEETPSQVDPATSLSKRAARRVIQRAYVLMGRDKLLRQQIRECETITLWIVEDWELEWTVHLHRGKFEVERRPAKHPDVTLSWATAEEFFAQVDHTGAAPLAFQMIPPQDQRRFFETLMRGFFTCLRRVLAHPFDDAGESLL